MITARSNQNKKLFFVEIQESDLTARTCHEENGKYYFEDKDDRQYQNCETKKDEFQIESFYHFIFILVMRMLKNRNTCAQKHKENCCPMQALYLNQTIYS